MMKLSELKKLEAELETLVNELCDDPDACFDDIKKATARQQYVWSALELITLEDRACRKKLGADRYASCEQNGGDTCAENDYPMDDAVYWTLMTAVSEHDYQLKFNHLELKGA